MYALSGSPLVRHAPANPSRSRGGDGGWSRRLSGADVRTAPRSAGSVRQKADYQGGMVIGAHGGPNGQVFYADTDPKPEQGTAESSPQADNGAWFHTLAYGLFPYHFEMVGEGATATVIYVTDYSVVDRERADGADRQQMPAPTAADTFADATELTYAVETGVRGAMGPDLMPFSDPDDAAAFVGSHGGHTVSYDDIDRPLIDTTRTAGGE